MIDCPICKCDKSRITGEKCPQCDSDLSIIINSVKRTDAAREKIEFYESEEVRKRQASKRRYILLAIGTFFFGLLTLQIWNMAGNAPGKKYAELYEKAKNELSVNPDFRDVSVNMHSNVIELTGTVPSDLHKQYITLLFKPVTAENLIDKTEIKVRDTAAEQAKEIPAFSYIVKKDESLSSIAYNIYGNWRKWEEIAKRNNIVKPYNIYAGQKLSLSF
jgi:nucleoid-associated protein YgaU